MVTVAGNLDGALAALKAEATPVLRELRHHEAYASPSERRRFKARRARSRRRRRGET
jgi:ribosomal protein S21